MPLTPETWLEKFVVNLTLPDTQDFPTITHLSNGTILVVWQSANNTGPGSALGIDLIGQLFTSQGVRIGTEIRMNENFVADNEQDPAVEALANGGFATVYEDDDGTTSSIRLTQRDNAGLHVRTVTIADDASVSNDPTFRNPAIASSSGTSVLVVWQEEEAGSGDSSIDAAIYNPSTGAVTQLASPINFTGANDIPEVVALENGNYVIVSASNVAGDASSSIVYRILSSTGANVLAVTKVIGTATDSDSDTDPSIAALTGGGFVISWTQNDGFDTDVVFRVYDSAGIQTASGALGSGSLTNDNNESTVVALKDGGFLVIYDNDELGRLDVERFSAAGTQIGSTYVIDADGNGIDDPDAELLEDGRVAVTWQQPNGEIAMEIIDIRDNANAPAVYNPAQQVGTIGDDVFTADSGNGTVYGHTGNDTITEAPSGSSTIFGGAGNDRIIVTSGIVNDAWHGDDNIDTIDWSASGESAGTFNLATGIANDEVNSEVMTGFENLIGTANADSIIGSSGNNSLNGSGGNDTIFGGIGDDILDGGANDDRLQGGLGTDTVDGGGGNDLIQVLDGEFFDNVDGGTGIDTLDHSDVTRSGDIFDFETGTITSDFDAGTPTLAAIEIYRDGSGSNTIISSGTGGTYFGNQGSDIMIAEAGDETMFGGGGADTLDLSRGNVAYTFNTLTGVTQLAGELFQSFETVIFGTANDTVTTRSDLTAETIYGGDGNDTITDLTGTSAGAQDSYDGGAGIDTLIYTGLGAGGFTVDLLAGNLFVGAISRDDIIRIENVTLTGGDNNIIGNAADNVLIAQGAAAENSFSGGAGNDRLLGGAGNDILDGGSDLDRLFGGSGNDSLSGGSGNDSLSGDLGRDRLDGGTGNDVMEGGNDDDTYFVDNLGDQVVGEIGFASGGGIDTVHTSVDFTAPDNVEILRALAGVAGVDLTGNDAPGTLVGNEFANVLNGRGGNDQVNGNAGNDTLTGGEGLDTLVGGTGADEFIYNAVSNSRAGAANRDVINGFDRGATQDIINLDPIDANTGLAGDQDFTFIGTAAFTAAGQVRVLGLGGPNAVIVEINVNADLAADMQIFVNLQTTMVAGDFDL